MTAAGAAAPSQRVASAAAAGLAVVVLAGFTAPAMAGAATTPSYAAGAAATLYSGLAFDTCTAPTLATVRACGASPYHRRRQPHLRATAADRDPGLTQVSRLKWRLLPVYKGLRAPRGGKPTDQKITRPSTLRPVDVVSGHQDPPAWLRTDHPVLPWDEKECSPIRSISVTWLMGAPSVERDHGP